MKIRTVLDNFKRPFSTDESGGITAFTMFGVVTCCMVAGVAVDVANVYRQKEHLTLAVDAAAFAGIVAVAEQKSAADVRTDILAAVEKNMPVDVFGKVTDVANDIELVRFDPATKALSEGTPNAVKVTLRRDDSVSNPVKTSLLRLVGFNDFELEVSSVAYYGQPGRCVSSDGIYGKGQVTMTSGNWVGPSYCVHSQTSVWLPQQNFFAPGSGVSMPSLAACKGKCVDSANPGIEAAKFTMNLELPTVSEHISTVTTAMRGSGSKLKTEVFANKPMLSGYDYSILTTAKITTKQQEKNLARGSVVNPTAAQYNNLMALTNGVLPPGLVYDVDCRDKGNGPATSISIGGGKDRKNATLASTSLETVRNVVLITDCAFDVGDYARVDNSVMISTRVSSSSVINASEGAVVGDPAKNCDLNRKVYILTMSGVSVSSNFTASNVAIIVNGDINVAANSNSSDVTHKGTSLHAEGSIHIPSSHTFNSCAEDMSGLLPGIRTFKFVMPS